MNTAPPPISTEGSAGIDAVEEPDCTAPNDFYTIAVLKETSQLLACVPDGQNALSAVYRRYRRSTVEAPDMDEIEVISGLTLTNIEDSPYLVFETWFHDKARLFDKFGNEYLFAIRGVTG